MKNKKRFLKAVAALTMAAAMTGSVFAIAACKKDKNNDDDTKIETPITYTVTFDLNYETTNKTSQVTVNDGGKATKTDPTRTGYTFDGWYTAATGGTKVELSTYTVSGNVTLYAHWTEVSEGPGDPSGGGSGGTGGESSGGGTGGESSGGGESDTPTPTPTAYKTYAQLSASADKILDDADLAESTKLSLMYDYYGVKGFYAKPDGGASAEDNHVDVTDGKLVQTTKGSNLATVIDFGLVAGVVEGYAEFTPSDMGTKWKLVQFMNSTGSTVFTLYYNGKTEADYIKYMVGSGAEQDAEENVATLANTLYKMYFKFDLTSGKVTVYVNEKCIVEDREANIKDIAGIQIISSSSGARQVTVDNVAVANEVAVADLAAQAKKNIDAVYAKYNVTTKYTTNQSAMETALNTAKTAFDATDATKESIVTAYETAIKAFSAVESDEELALKARDTATLDIEVAGEPDEVVFANDSNFAANGTGGLTSGYSFGKTWLQLTTPGTIKWKTENSGSGLSANGSTMTVTTTQANSTLAVTYYSTNGDRHIKIQKSGEGSYLYDNSSSQWKTDGGEIVLADVGTYTIEFAGGEHKLTSMSLAAPQTISGAEVTVSKLEGDVSATTSGVTVSNVVLTYEYEGKEGTLNISDSSKYTVIVKQASGEVVSSPDSLEAGEYTVIVIFGASKTEGDAKVTNSFSQTVTVTAD